jgi:flagellin-like protein
VELLTNDRITAHTRFIDEKGITPLFATLLLMAVAITASAVTYTWVMSMMASQSGMAQIQIRTDEVVWDVVQNKVIIAVRNTGSVSATVDFVSIRPSSVGSELDTMSVVTSIPVGRLAQIEWTGSTLILTPNTLYVIRVTCTTGLYYEMTRITPMASIL